MSNVWNDQTPSGFTVQRVTSDNSGGDFVRGRPVTRQNALRYKVTAVVPSTASAKVATKSTLTAVATGFVTEAGGSHVKPPKGQGVIELSWGWPKDYSDWTEVAIVRSGFGHPSTVNDGITVFRSTKDEYEFFDGAEALTIVIEDDQITAGRWYYYTLFFFRTEWEPVMFTEALTPRDFGHFDHLWEGIPEYYRWVDSRFRGQEGHLQQFLKLFGFELDMTREYVESWQEAYHIDNSPQPLLYQVGLNLGVDTGQSLGEIRTRSLISQINQLYDKRGTAEGLKLVIEASSKYTTTVTSGRNMLLLPDDSEFITGTGNWVLFNGGVPMFAAMDIPMATGTAFNARCISTPGATMNLMAPSAVGTAFNAYVIGLAGNTGQSAPGAPVTVLPPDDVTLYAPYVTSDRAANAGYGVMAVLAGNNRPAPPFFDNKALTWACGFGTTSAEHGSQLLTPKHNGVPVEQNIIYGFSCFFKGANLTSSVTLGIKWFDRNELYLGESTSVFPVDGTWQELLVQGLSYYKNNISITMGAGLGQGTAFDAMTTSTVGIDWNVGTMRGYGAAQGVALDALCYVDEFHPKITNSRRTVYAEYAGAVFAVPFITVANRSSGDDYKVMGCMFYDAGPGGTTTALSPDYFLTLYAGVIGETTGKLMGG